MAFEKMTDDQRRVINFGMTFNKHEHFILKCIAERFDLNLADTVRRLIEEDNERHHYDLIEPEWARPRNREAAKITD